MFRRIRKIAPSGSPTQPLIVTPASAPTVEVRALPERTPPSPAPVEPSTSSTTAASPSNTAQPRRGSKLAIVVELLAAPEGVSLTRLVEVTGWQQHTARAALTGLRKRGYVVVSEKVKDSDGAARSVYRIVPAKVAR